MSITRIYPIRKSRANWFIRLYSIHECETHSSFLKDCNLKDNIETSLIHLAEFKEDNPKGINGSLVNSDKIVIPDNKINLIIDFPLINSVTLSITSKSGSGFTLKEIIQVLIEEYKNIYKEETETAPEKTYELEKLCYKCIFEKDLSKCVLDVKIEQNKDNECPICYQLLENQVGQLCCGHYFHFSCIKEWINFEGKNCPICRKAIKDCPDCNGKLIINYNYTGKVIPLEQRGIILNRNLTFGKYGIYCFDFENLFLKGFWYDKKNKNLKVFIET